MGNLKLFNTFENEELFLNTIKYLSDVIDAKDAYTIGHSERVQKYAIRIGKKLKLKKDEMDILYLSSLLHDIGKVKIPISILKSKKKLNKYEYMEIQRHAIYGAYLLGSFKYVSGLQDAIKYHHERFDGKGYPEGLKGKDIPIYSRIIAVCDAFDAITSFRSYTKELKSGEYAIKEIKKNVGTQFDPEIVDAFMSIYNKGYIHLEKGLYYIKQHNVDTSIPAFNLLQKAEKLLTSKKDKAFCKYNIGKILIRTGNVKRGIDNIKNYLYYVHSCEEKAEIYNALSSAYLLIDDFEKVMFYSSKVIEGKSVFHTARAYRHLAKYYCTKNQFVKAKKTLEKSEILYKNLEKKLKKDKEKILKNNFSIIKYNQLINMGKKIQGDIAKYYDVKGFMYYNEGNFIESMRFYKKSIELKHFYEDIYGSIRSQSGIALVYMQQKRYKNAEYNLFEAESYALKLNDIAGLYMVYTNMGKLYDLWNKKDKAIKYYERAMKIAIKLNKQSIAGEVFLYLLMVYKNRKTKLKVIQIFKNLKIKMKNDNIYSYIIKNYFKMNNKKMNNFFKEKFNLLKYSNRNFIYAEVYYYYIDWLRFKNDKIVKETMEEINNIINDLPESIIKRRLKKIYDFYS